MKKKLLVFSMYKTALTCLLMIFFLALAHVSHAQTPALTWQNFSPQQFPADLVVLGDNGYLYINVKLSNAVINNPKITITLPQGVDFAGTSKIAIITHDTVDAGVTRYTFFSNPTLSGTAAAGDRKVEINYTGNSNTLRVDSTIVMKINIRALCDINTSSPGSYTITFSGTQPTITDYTRTIAASLQKPILRIAAAPDVIPFARVLDTNLVSLNIDAQNGYATSALIALRYNGTIIYLDSFKIDGIFLPLSMLANTNASAGGTVLHNSRVSGTEAPSPTATSQITYIRLDQSVLNGNIDNIVRHLTFRATANTGCDQTITMEVRHNLPTNCTTTPGNNTIILNLPSASTTPQFSYAGELYVIDGADTLRNSWHYVCFDGVTPFYTRTIFTNTNATATAALNFNSYFPYEMHPAMFSDTSQIFFQVSVPSKIDGSDSITHPKTRIIGGDYIIPKKTVYNPATVYDTYFFNDPEHFTPPLLDQSGYLTIKLPIKMNNPIPPGAKIEVFQTYYANPAWSLDSYRSKSNFTTSQSNGYNTFLMRYLGQYFQVRNICGTLATVEPMISSAEAYLPAFFSAGGDVTLYPNQPITISNQFRSGGAGYPVNTLSTTDPAAKPTGARYAEVFVKLPSWCSLDTTSAGITSAFTIGTTAPAAGSGTYDAVNNIYSVRYYTNLTGLLNIKLLPGDCPTGIGCTPLTDTIQIWADWISGTPETACRPRFKKTTKIFSKVAMSCQTPALEIKEFGVYRETRGYKDSNNDHLPDDGTPALDSEMQHWHFIVRDTGYYYIKGMIGGTVTDIWDTLFTELTYCTGGAINAISQYSWNTIGTTTRNTTPFWNDASITIQKKVEGTTDTYPLILPNPVSPFYTLTAIFDGKTHYQPKGGDSIFIKIPFVVVNGPDSWSTDSKGSMLANTYGSKAALPECRGDYDATPMKITFRTLSTTLRTATSNEIYFYFTGPGSEHTLGKNPNGPSYPNTPNYPYQGNSSANTYGCTAGSFWHDGPDMNVFANEVRHLHKLLNCTIRVPAGYYKTEPKVHFSFAKWMDRTWAPDTALYPTSATFEIATGDSLLYFDFSQMIDYDWNGSQAGITYDPVTGKLSNGKYPIGDDVTGGAHVLPIMATPGSGPVAVRAIYTFEDLSGGTIRNQYTNSDHLVYYGPALSLFTSPSTLYVNHRYLSLPSVVLLNPNDVTDNNVWLFLKGNVENGMLIAGTDTIFGKGLNNCWFEVGTLTPLQEKNYRLTFSYKEGKSGCTNDTIMLYSVVDGLYTNYNPDINYSIDSVPVINRGGFRATILDVLTQKARIAGNLSVLVPNPLKPGSLHYLDPYLLDVTIDGRVSQAALYNPCVTITVPAGQLYVDTAAAYGAAWFEYPQGTVRPIPAAVLTAMKDAIGVASNDFAERSFTFCASELMEESPFVMPGFGAVSTSDDERVIKIHIPLVPNCQTELTGIRFTGTFSGNFACGDPCLDNGLFYNSSRIYSDVLTDYTFTVGLQNIDFTKRVFTPEKLTDMLVATFTKNTGISETIQSGDRIFLRLPKELEVAGAIVCEQFGGYTVTILNDYISGNEHIYELSLPSSQLNALIGSGRADSTFKYQIPVLYTPNPMGGCVAPKRDATCQVVTNKDFAMGICAASPMAIGSGDLSVLILEYDVDEYFACLNVVTPLTVTCPGVTPVWYANSAGTIPLGVTGNTYEYTPAVQKDTAFYFRAYYVYGTPQQEDFGMASIHVKMNPEVKANFTADTACTGTHTTLTNTSTIGGVASTASNTEKWYWYLDGATTPLDSTQNLSVALHNNDVIRLVVISKEGCENDKEVKVMIKECNLIDCNTTSKTATENSCGVGYYTHSGTGWNIVPLPLITFDSTRYYVDGILISRGIGATLNGAVFTTGAPHHVEAIAYLGFSTDTCKFLVTVNAIPNAVANTINVVNDTICTSATSALTAAAPTVTSPVFKWYNGQGATATLLWTGATYTTPALTANTTYYVAVSGTNFCENVAGTRKPLEVAVKVCDLIDCNATAKTATADDCSTGFYTHSGAGWDIKPLGSIVFDSVKYVVNGILRSTGVSATLHGVQFTTVAPQLVEAIAYLGAITDTCKFMVTVNAMPIAVLSDLTVLNDLICEGKTTTLTATSALNNPVFRWYNSQSATATLLWTGATFTTSALYADTAFYVSVSNAAHCENIAGTRAKTTVTVVPPPAPPILTVPLLPAFQGTSIDLSAAVTNLSGLTYTYYANADGTGKLSGSTITYNPPKNDYYVSASNGSCESDLSKIMLQDPCPTTVSDGEGHIYKVTSLAGFCWTENLRATLYADNTPIDFAHVYTCPNCPAQLDTIFGLLYDWYSAMRISRVTQLQGICPNGWHVPSQAEWSTLNRYEASKLKSMYYWLIPPGAGTNDYGFDARPAGWYNSALNRYQDLYGFAGWWASDADGVTASAFYISYYCSKVEKEIKTKVDGLSVRCVMDF